MRRQQDLVEKSAESAVMTRGLSDTINLSRPPRTLRCMSTSNSGMSYCRMIASVVILWSSA
eukprot:6482459-Amphidinium_carterae.1